MNLLSVFGSFIDLMKSDLHTPFKENLQKKLRDKGCKRTQKGELDTSFGSFLDFLRNCVLCCVELDQTPMHFSLV